MNYNFIKRLVICSAIGIFTITVGCAGDRIKIGYEKNDNPGYSDSGHKHKYKKKGPPALPQIYSVYLKGNL